MSKSRFVFDKFAKVLEQGLVSYKDLSDEVINVLKSKRDEIIFRMKLASKEEIEILNKRIAILEKKIEQTKKVKKSKSSKKVSFNPLNKGKVSLYVCGMTVYDSCHIGHLRTFLSFDFIVKSFKALNYDVHYVRNISNISYIMDIIVKSPKGLNYKIKG